jgi:outer membrane protein OmpA-like peptidoglycan-associated protein
LLDKLLEIMLQKPAMKIEIGGHTDSDGDAVSNQLLSQQRADAVRDYLISRGVTASRITSRGFGETKPVADNGTAEGRQRNRRTEVSILAL